MSARSFLIRGLLAGLLAGVFAFGVAYAVGEPSVNAAIAIEEAGGGHEHGTDHDHGTGAEAPADEPAGGETEVPRSLQSTVGLLTATVVAGVTLGGLIGVLSALALGRFGGLGARASTLLVTGIGFTALYVVPFVAYPPNPPAVGQGDTIGLRSALFFTLMAISVIAAITAVLVGRRLATRLGAWHAALAVIAAYVLVVVIAIAVLPTYNEVPAEFPAALLYEFRTASFLTQLSLWAVLGVALAELTGRITRPAVDRSRAYADTAV